MLWRGYFLQRFYFVHLFFLLSHLHPTQVKSPLKEDDPEHGSWALGGQGGRNVGSAWILFGAFVYVRPSVAGLLK